MSGFIRLAAVVTLTLVAGACANPTAPNAAAAQPSGAHTPSAGVECGTGGTSTGSGNYC
jgi:hypothetical protein